MTEPEHQLRNSTLVRRVLVAWVVAVRAVAIGAFLLVFHEPSSEEHMVPRWNKPPVAGAEEWDDDLSVPHSTGRMLPQSGSSTAPSIPPDPR